jgi:predicted RNase H-like HicB family nuclease
LSAGASEGITSQLQKDVLLQHSLTRKNESNQAVAAFRDEFNAKGVAADIRIDWSVLRPIARTTDQSVNSATAAALASVFALGASRDEAETRIAQALAAHLAYLRESGRPVPEPHTHAGRVAA